MAIIKKLFLVLSLLLMNIFCVTVHADIADIPTSNPTGIIGIIAIIVAIVVAAAALLSAFKKKD